MGGGLRQAVAIEPRAEGPRLYQHHPDAEGGHLLGQGLGGPLQGGFGGGVISVAQGTPHPADGGDVADPSPAPLPHTGKGGPDEVHGPEEVDCKELCHLMGLALFDGSPVAVAGVVHQHVDAAEGALGLRHRPGNAVCTAEVQRQGQGPAGVGRGKGCQGGRVPGGEGGPVSPGQDGFGDPLPQAAGAAGDEPSSLHGLPPHRI